MSLQLIDGACDGDGVALLIDGAHVRRAVIGFHSDRVGTVITHRLRRVLDRRLDPFDVSTENYQIARPW